MPVDLLKQVEAVPVAYPGEPSGLSPQAVALDAAMIWARIEAYTAHRFSERTVVWILEGGEDDAWTPPLTPVVSSTAEKWESGAWVSVTMPEGPLGLCLPSDGTFRVTAQVGGGDLRHEVSEAFRRLAEYLADDSDRAGASEYSTTVGGELSESYRRNPAWVARAMQNSGAGDLLRSFRRA